MPAIGTARSDDRSRDDDEQSRNARQTSAHLCTSEDERTAHRATSSALLGGDRSLEQVDLLRSRSISLVRLHVLTGSHAPGPKCTSPPMGTGDTC